MSLARHRQIIKALSLHDKEAEAQLVQLYYETPIEDRPQLLDAMARESEKIRKKLLDLELNRLEQEERAIAKIVDAAEEARGEREEGVRGEGARGNDEEDGAGNDPE